MHARQHLNIPKELRERPRSARSVFVLAGAGVSAERGAVCEVLPLLEAGGV